MVSKFSVLRSGVPQCEVALFKGTHNEMIHAEGNKDENKSGNHAPVKLL